jgi:hypothetical protein
VDSNHRSRVRKGYRNRIRAGAAAAMGYSHRRDDGPLEGCSADCSSECPDCMRLAKPRWPFSASSWLSCRIGAGEAQAAHGRSLGSIGCFPPCWKPRLSSGLRLGALASERLPSVLPLQVAPSCWACDPGQHPGFDPESTLAKYRFTDHGPRSPGWQAFLHNHTAHIAGIDLFVVPTVGCSTGYSSCVWSATTGLDQCDSQIQPPSGSPPKSPKHSMGQAPRCLVRNGDTS